MPDAWFDSADYELVWPRALFARELAALRASAPEPGMLRGHKEFQERIEFLLEAAFLGQTPAADFRRAAATAPVQDDPWGAPAPPTSVPAGADSFLDQLVDCLPLLREHHRPKPYWPDRHGRTRDLTDARSSLRHRFTALTGEMRGQGMFGRDLPPECVDDDDPVREADVLAARLGLPDLWPLQPQAWDEDTFLGLIEVFHDLAVWPRERYLHSYNGCGLHYSTFSTDTGRALYRWRINELLASGGVDLRLAEDGEDVGRLVRVVDDARADLVGRMLHASDSETGGRVEHAIALFRRREATEHDKRSAIVALATVLEDRKRLLEAALFTADEDALFHIANKFDLRHRNDKQHADYDPAFRDWVFWWYLATIELTDRLLARQDIRAAAGE